MFGLSGLCVPAGHSVMFQSFSMDLGSKLTNLTLMLSQLLGPVVFRLQLSCFQLVLPIFNPTGSCWAFATCSKHLQHGQFGGLIKAPTETRNLAGAFGSGFWMFLVDTFSHLRDVRGGFSESCTSAGNSRPLSLLS